MPAPASPRSLSFQARLERIATGIEYYGLSVPANITAALGTKAAVPVMARINGSSPFLISLYPRGGGRHGLRVKASVRAETQIKEGDRVRVQITVRDRAAEVCVPADLAAALRAEGLLATFQALPPGQRSFTLRRIEQAVQPQTRDKRIRAALAGVRKK
jgi:hypothetical protein